MRVRRRVGMPTLALLALLLVVAAAAVGPSASAGETGPVAAPPDPARLHPELLRALQCWGMAGSIACEAGLPAASGGYFSVIVEWPRERNLAARVAAIPDSLVRRRQVIALLQVEAQQRSGPLQELVNAAVRQGLARRVRTFWVSPVMALEARPELIAQLSRRADVRQVRPDQQFALADLSFQEVPASQSAASLPWNLSMLGVAQADFGLGLDGKGIVVASLDTGVDWQHPALLSRYRGYREHGLAVHQGNWHVSTDEPYIYPGDGSGHGTHTMGIMVGEEPEGRRVGVAPGARWIAVKAFNNAGYAYESWLHDAFQWILAPEGDPSLAPDVVNNSWSSDVSSDTRFLSDVEALSAAGILPIFAAGNEGPRAGSVGSPASFPAALAVGAVDEEGALASFSGRGPSPWDETKPDVVAPGVHVVSTYPGGGYAENTGTSMAAPHVTGLVALLLQASPGLSPDELEALLKETARPLGAFIPNDDAGWGLVNAYAAGLRVSDSGEVVGRVTRTDGAGVAHSSVSAAREGSEPVMVAGAADGRFTLALQPGRYNISAHAFAYEPATAHNVTVTSGTQVSLTLSLTPQPAGAIFGRVTDLETGAPLSATVVVAGTPVEAQTDPHSGLYSIALPEGVYDVSVTATAHRIGRLQATVIAGIGQQFDLALAPAPRILLVDSGRWYYDSQIGFFADVLEALDYPFVLRPVRDPFGQLGSPGDSPTAPELLDHDVVIWSAPSDAPGLVGADAALTGYLAAGRRLWVTGRDVAFWDGGGSAFVFPASYFTDSLGLWFEGEDNSGNLAGAGPLSGLSLALNTTDSAGQQYGPDSAEIRRPLLTEAMLRWSDGAVGGVTAGVCRPYRAAWLGFGLEGAGPRDARVAAADRILSWLGEEPARYGLAVAAANAPLVGLPGAVVSQTITIDATGVNSDTLGLLVEGGPWPLELVLPDGRRVGGDAEFTVAGCSQAVIQAAVAIPPGQPRDALSTHILRIASRNAVSVTASVTITAKTPAPILLVNDDRWYDYHERYVSALNELGLSHDDYTTGGDATPSSDILERYPLVVWTTGYDWYRPLSDGDEERLGDYLDAGGRLLLSSQDLLDVSGLSDFVRTRLGVIAASLSITATDVLALPAGPLGEDLGPWRLKYPFANWSDGLGLSAAGRGVLQDEHQLIVGAVRPASTWRTAFFAFPLEAMDDGARRTLLARTLLWLSPLGESRLDAPPLAAEGSRIPLTLTLGLADAAPRSDLRAELPLPAEVSLAPGSLVGPWDYDPSSRTLSWLGDLAPGDPITLTAALDLANGLADGRVVTLRARLCAGDGITLTAETPVVVDSPWLALAASAAPLSPALESAYAYTLTATNAGLLATTAHLTGTLPAGLAFVPGTAWASQGSVTVAANRLTWTGWLEPTQEAAIGFQARVTVDRPGARLAARAELTDARGRRSVAWAVVRLPSRTLLPLALR